MTESNQSPSFVDKRSGAISGTETPYGPLPTPEEIRERESKRGRNRTKMERWAPGTDPHDQDARPDSGWEYVKLDVTEGKEGQGVDHFAGLSGPDSGVRCFQCKSTNYRILDERSSETVAGTQDDIAWAKANNRPFDKMRAPNVIGVFCPNCKQVAQFRESIFRELQGEEVRNYAE